MHDKDDCGHYVRAEDGLGLHYIDVAPADESERIPAVCLPGLTRSSDDFLPLAQSLARSTTPRRVLAFDYRGRGRSDHDPDWRHYTLDIERADFLAILDDLNVRRAHFIGTSRGGLHILALAAARRDIIQSAVFNDIGPVLEPAGLARIKSYVGKSVSPRSYEEAIAILKNGSGRHFDGLSPADWQHFAETTFGYDESHLGLRYDPQLAHTLDAFDPDEPLPQYWELFDALDCAPVLTIRGETSDLLSETTLAAMGSRWPGSRTYTVPGQGHAPLLTDSPTQSRIDTFLGEADASVRES